MTFRLLSWNIANSTSDFCSHHAPVGYTQRQKHRHLLNILRQHLPDVVSWQEARREDRIFAAAAAAPSSNTATAGEQDLTLDSLGAGMISRTVSEHDTYTLLGHALSHCEEVQLYVRQPRSTAAPAPGTLLASVIGNPVEIEIRTAGGRGGYRPYVLARATHVPTGKPFFLAAVHLMPFAEGASARATAFADILRQVPGESPLVIFGDTNMRQTENDAIARLGLDDAYVLATGGKRARANSSSSSSGGSYHGPPHGHTFNTKVNPWHPLMPGQHPYSARYDRVWLRGMRVVDFAVLEGRIDAATGAHYLSDHFGILVTLDLL